MQSAIYLRREQGQFVCLLPHGGGGGRLLRTYGQHQNGGGDGAAANAAAIIRMPMRPYHTNLGGEARHAIVDNSSCHTQTKKEGNEASNFASERVLPDGTRDLNVSRA